MKQKKTCLLPLVLVVALGARAFAQPAGPNVLTPAQVAVFDQLVGAAKKVDPTFIQAQLTEGQKRAELSPLGAVTGNLSAGAGVSLGNSGGFDQVQPGYRLSASAGVDLAALARTFTKSNRAQLDALTNSTSAAGRDLRVRVLQSHTAYLRDHYHHARAGAGVHRALRRGHAQHHGTCRSARSGVQPAECGGPLVHRGRHGGGDGESGAAGSRGELRRTRVHFPLCPAQTLLPPNS